jgi:hypothetical protein
MLFAVTDLEAGWDCLRGVYEVESEEKLEIHLAEERGITIDEFRDRYVIHEVYNGIEKI